MEIINDLLAPSLSARIHGYPLIDKYRCLLINLDEIMHLLLIHQNRGSTQEHTAPSSLGRTSQEMESPTMTGRFTFRVWLFQDEPTNVYTLIGGAILLLARAGIEPTEWNKVQASASYMRIQQQ